MKKILLILSLLLITGCSVNYDLTVTNKHEVKEKFRVMVSNEVIEKSNKSVDEYLDYYSNLYLSNDGYKEYSIKTKKTPQPYFKVTRNYKGLNEYFGSLSFKSMFNSANIEETDKYVTVRTSENAYLIELKNNPDIVTKYDQFQIRIKFYNEVIESNADEIDKSDNIYIWNVTENDNDSSIYFKIGPKVKYLVVIKDWFITNLAAIITIASTILLITSVAIIIYIKSKKNNEV